jgi:hypothetical protein
MLRQVGETSVAYYFGKLAGADLVIDASGPSRQLLAGSGMRETSATDPKRKFNALQSGRLE